MVLELVLVQEVALVVKKLVVVEVVGVKLLVAVLMVLQLVVADMDSRLAVFVVVLVMM